MADTHRGAVLSICATPQNGDLNQAAFEALTFIAIADNGSNGDTGIVERTSSYPTLSTALDQFAKAGAAGAAPDIDVAYKLGDAGQDALRAASLTDFNYAFKYESSDAASGVVTNTIEYDRRLVMKPVLVKGDNDAFVVHRYPTQINQSLPIVESEAV